MRRAPPAGYNLPAPESDTPSSTCRRPSELLSIFGLLQRLGKFLNDDAEPVFAVHGLTWAQAQAIIKLEPEEGLTHADLAWRMGITSSTLTGIIKRLEREGWVERRENHRDNREKLIYLSVSGETKRLELFRALREQHPAFRALLRMNDEDRVQLFRTLHVLYRVAYDDQFISYLGIRRQSSALDRMFRPPDSPADTTHKEGS